MLAFKTISILLVLIFQPVDAWTPIRRQTVSVNTTPATINTMPGASSPPPTSTTNPGKWCKSKRAAAQPSSLSSPIATTGTSQMSSEGSPVSTGLTITSTTSFSTTVTTSLPNPLPASSATLDVTSTGFQISSASPGSPSSSIVSSMTSPASPGAPMSTMLVLSGPSHTLTLGPSGLSISTAENSVPYVVSMYTSKELTFTSALGPLITACVPTTTVTAAGVNGSVPVTFGQCGTGIGPMMTPPIAPNEARTSVSPVATSSNSPAIGASTTMAGSAASSVGSIPGKRGLANRYIERSTFASWTMIEPRAIARDSSLSTMSQPAQSATSTPFSQEMEIPQPLQNAAKGVTAPCLSGLLTLLGSGLLFNIVIHNGVRRGVAA